MTIYMLRTDIRQIHRRYHPDENPDNAEEAEEMFKEINSANAILRFVIYDVC